MKKGNKIPVKGISQSNTLEKSGANIGGKKNDSISPVSIEKKSVKI